MEDIAEWERSLQGAVTLLPSHPWGGSLTSVSEGGPLTPGEPDLPPSEFDEEEIAERAAQAEEAEFWADLVAADAILNSGDANDINSKNLDEDVDMA
jgi:hypothetical protein